MVKGTKRQPLHKPCLGHTGHTKLLGTFDHITGCHQVLGSKMLLDDAKVEPHGQDKAPCVGIRPCRLMLSLVTTSFVSHLKPILFPKREMAMLSNPNITPASSNQPSRDPLFEPH